MSISSSRKTLGLLVVMGSSLLLSACGEGWEMQQVSSFPYGNERTAGTAIAYVQAKMLPEKQVKIESVTRDFEPEETVVEAPPAKEPVIEPEPMAEESAQPVPDPTSEEVKKKMDEVFRDAQRK